MPRITCADSRVQAHGRFQAIWFKVLELISLRMFLERPRITEGSDIYHQQANGREPIPQNR